MADVLGQTTSRTCLLTDRDFFRSAGDGRKALVQITERCNLHCAHCFVSAKRDGLDLSVADFGDLIVPRLLNARVRRITLTGGEPFAHPDVLDFCEIAAAAGMSVGICTNATTINDDQIEVLRRLRVVRVNVSLDGFSTHSHGKFRGVPGSFEITVRAVRRLADAGILQGILSTPNALTKPHEYQRLAQFAVEVRCKYLLMNPLSAFGRGVKSKRRLAATSTLMTAVREAAALGGGSELEVVPIRFPNDRKPLSRCVAGDIVYVFANGAVAVCPYLVFAARSPGSRYADGEFLVGNILELDVADALDAYSFHDRFAGTVDPKCAGCGMTASCGKGCPAAVVAAGGMIGDRDVEVCPVP